MNKEELESYIKEHSTYEAAEHFGCSYGKIRYWVGKFNIGKRGKYKENLEKRAKARRLREEKECNKRKICKKCGKEFKPQKGLINFCSMICRNTREHSEETKNKISNSMKTSEKGIQSTKNLHEIYAKSLKEKGLSPVVKDDAYFKFKLERHIELFMSKNFNELGEGTRRERVIYEQDYKCHRCGLSDWQGEKITLELEHMDGNHHNNERINLIALCPNCHSLTPSWRGKNINKATAKKTPDEVLIDELIKTDFNFTQALKNLNMAGAKNHSRCKRLMKFYVGIKEKLEKET